MAREIVIFPEPRSQEWFGDTVALASGRAALTVSVDDDAGALIGSATLELERAATRLGGSIAREVEGRIRIEICEGATEFAPQNPEQAYELRIDEGGATIRAAAPLGAYYGAVTLCGLMCRDGDAVIAPAGVIRDWPDLAWRGLFAESRWGQDLMTLEDWKDAIDTLSRMKLNVLTVGIYNCWPIQYEGEVSEFLFVPLKGFPELNRPQTIEYYSRKAGEWKTLKYLPRMVEDDFFGEVVAYGQTRGVMVRPHFNTPGHNTLIPRMIPDVSALDENGEPTGYGFCLSNERTYEVMFQIIDEICDRYLLPNGVRSYHIAADEVYPLVGMHPDRPYRRIDPWCKCETCRQKPDSEWYVDYIVRIAAHLKEKGIEHISMWHDQLVRGGVMNQSLATKFEQAGLTRNIILHWWKYSDFFETTMPELGFRRWVTPMSGYFYQMPYRGHIDNIFLAERLGVAEGAEGTESYGVFDNAFHRHFCAMSEWSWNNAGGGEPEEFAIKYAKALFADDWRQGLRGLRHFSGIVDDPVCTSLAGSLFRYAYDYGQSHEQARARDNYPQAQLEAIWDTPPGMSASQLGALRSEARRAARELSKARWLDERLKQIYLVECERIAVMAGAFTTCMSIIAAYHKLRMGVAADEAIRSGQTLAESSDRLGAALEEMEGLLASIEEHREHYVQPHMLRELSFMRRFMTTLLGSLNVVREQIMSHRITTLPELEVLRVKEIPWEG